jgi:hypothetical protein
MVVVESPTTEEYILVFLNTATGLARLVCLEEASNQILLHEPETFDGRLYRYTKYHVTSRVKKIEKYLVGQIL